MGNATILANSRFFAGGCDLTGQTNKAALTPVYEKKDKTVYGPPGVGSGGWQEFVAGLGSAKIAQSGFWAAGDLSMVDDATWAALGAGSAYTAFAETAAGLATYGDVAYLTRMLTSKYAIGDAPGELAPYALDGESDGPMARGVGIHPPGTARTATGFGTAVQHVAVPTGRHMYATLHMLSVSGTSAPSLTVKVQSAPTLAFAAPTDRITFTPSLDRGGQNGNVIGPITDAFWRVSYTLNAGVTPSFLFVVAIGVAN